MNFSKRHLHLKGQNLPTVAWLKQQSRPSPSNTTEAAAFDWKVLRMRILEVFDRFERDNSQKEEGWFASQDLSSRSVSSCLVLKHLAHVVAEVPGSPAQDVETTDTDST